MVSKTLEMKSLAANSVDSKEEVRKWVTHGISASVHSNRSTSCTNQIQCIVEVRLKPRAAARFDTIKNLVHVFLNSYDKIGVPSTLNGWQDTRELNASVEKICVCESACPTHTLSLQEVSLEVHVYQPSDTDTFEEFSNSAGARADDDDTMAASVCELPNRSWEGLWESLIYADNIKLKLLDYIHATLVLSDANVDCECLKLRSSTHP
jgi:pachytene checkpoint protein 2